MSTGTLQGRGITRVGERCVFMARSHVAHDCQIGDDVIFADMAVLGGHVVVGDRALLGAQVAVHQHVRIGEGATLGGGGITADVIPFGVASGLPAKLTGLNLAGIMRDGDGFADVPRVEDAFWKLFLDGGIFRERVDRVAAEFSGDPMVGKIVTFIRGRGPRPLMKLASRSGARLG